MILAQTFLLCANIDLIFDMSKKMAQNSEFCAGKGGFEMIFVIQRSVATKNLGSINLFSILSVRKSCFPRG